MSVGYTVHRLNLKCDSHVTSWAKNRPQAVWTRLSWVTGPNLSFASLRELVVINYRRGLVRGGRSYIWYAQWVCRGQHQLLAHSLGRVIMVQCLPNSCFLYDRPLVIIWWWSGRRSYTDRSLKCVVNDFTLFDGEGLRVCGDFCTDSS